MSELDSVHDTRATQSHSDSQALYPDPARVPPYITAVEASSFKNESLGQVQVEIIPMTAEHAAWWHSTIQPRVKAHFRTASDATAANAGKKIRADLGWNWNKVFWLLNVHNQGHFSTRYAQPAFGLAMVARNKLGETVPIGMMTLVPSYYCNSDRLGSKTYTWFVSSAPQCFYEDYFKELKLDGVGKALFDAAIIASYRAGLDGSLLLHADPEGGKGLIRFYVQLGFKPLKFKFSPITLYRWRHRKEYMLLRAEGAGKIIKDNDPYRREGYLAD